MYLHRNKPRRLHTFAEIMFSILLEVSLRGGILLVSERLSVPSRSSSRCFDNVKRFPSTKELWRDTRDFAKSVHVPDQGGTRAFLPQENLLGQNSQDRDCVLYVLLSLRERFLFFYFHEVYSVLTLSVWNYPRGFLVIDFRSTDVASTIGRPIVPRQRMPDPPRRR